jgi:eukaryotic-like serine/threonine-protein kinase
MTPERLRQIEDLFQAARKGSADERETVLAEADPELRRVVESLLDAGSPSPAGMPASGESTQHLEDGAGELAAGVLLGPYRVEGKLGEGGMGGVFRATDTRLGRSVAIKIAHARFSSRFEREARAIASLNHPNICILHDIGPNYLVMELVEGETIAARLKKGPLPVEEVVRYARQIAAALVEAHAAGIIHRDLKPGNIMLAKSGAKVLDFGLARLEADATFTAERVVMGTPAYMAPEQREGRPVDARSDIYAFGLVLYEMLTGDRFVHRRKRIRARKLETIVSRCLEEDPARRWQTAAELERELATISRTKSGPIAVQPPPVAPAEPARKSTAVLGEFENKTGDPVFDGILRQGLSVQLEQSPFLTLISDRQIQQVLRFMNRPPDTRLTSEVTQEICERTDGAVVLEGSITGLGSHYVLWLRARDGHTGDILGQEQAQAERKEDVLSALARIATQVRQRLGESLATIREYSTPLEQATTSSLEALKAYSSGRIAAFGQGNPTAIPHLQHAIAIDPQFAMAYADLSIVYWNMGQTDLSAEYTRKAYELRGRVSDRERLWIQFLYDRQVTGNLPRLLQTLEAWVQRYPRDFLAHTVMAGWGTLGTGQYERGIRASTEALRLNPDDAFAYVGALHYCLLDRFEEAAALLRQAAEHKLEVPEYSTGRFYLAFFAGDQAGMEREVARARGTQGLEDWMWHNQALVLARSGQMQQARVMWERAIALADQAGNRERAAIYEAADAVCEAHFGNAEAARERARAALALGSGRDAVYAAAFALALSGDATEAQRLAENLETRFPEDTAVQFGYLPVLRALAAMARQAPVEAVERLHRALPYDLALPGTAFFAKFGGLYPTYIRGMAYLDAGRGSEAVAEFQKVLDHRGIVFADPIGALAHLQLGRAFVVSGKLAKARDAYQGFLSLWKNADADLPVLRQAKAEYAGL